MAMFGTTIQDFLANDVKGAIAAVDTGKEYPPEKQINETLGWMQVAMSSIDAIQVSDDPSLSNEEVQAQLFICLGPLFILCLLFDQTRDLFKRWLFYGIGTMFSMAVLAAMVGIVMTH